MTANRRIFLNIVATYGRSLYALAIGLFCGRWTLMALGEVDYGLMGVVGGLTAFISFLNGIMASGVGRFYALSVGEEQKDPVGGLEKCREWFTTAVVIHTVLPIALMAIGYPIGEWAVRHFLTIPPDRIDACVWVWRFTCISCFVGMASVPYHAMYGAKQEIAELTIYSFLTSTVNVLFMYYAVTHPGVWIVRISAWACFLSVVPSLVITWRSLSQYQECRFRKRYMHCWKHVFEMLRYSGWIAIGGLSWIMREQGVGVLINKFCGPAVNASMNIGKTLSSQCSSLSGSLLGAFYPVITSAYGAGNMILVRELSLRVCKISMVFIMIFSIPLALEVDEVLRLWLKDPPMYANGLCVCFLAMALVDKSSYGHMIAINAKGVMAWYQVFAGGVLLALVPIGWYLLYLGYNVYSVGAAIVGTTALSALVRVVFAKYLLNMSIRKWLTSVAIPSFILAVTCALLGFCCRFVMAESFYRVCLTTLVVEITLVCVSWLVVLDETEKAYISNAVDRFLKRIRRF